MKISAQVRLANYGSIVGFASVMLDDVLVIDGFKIVAGEQEVYILPPSNKYTEKKTNQEKNFPVCKFLSSDFKAKLEKAIFQSYKMAQAMK